MLNSATTFEVCRVVDFLYVISNKHPMPNRFHFDDLVWSLSAEVPHNSIYRRAIYRKLS